MFTSSLLVCRKYGQSIEYRAEIAERKRLQHADNCQGERPVCCRRPDLTFASQFPDVTVRGHCGRRVSVETHECPTVVSIHQQ
ncbi:MAG: hypothetical protein ACRD22_16215 [Terriglobia bacterium]